MGKTYSNKSEIISLLKQGVGKNVISKKYNIPISTVCYWYQLEKEKNPEEFCDDKVIPYEKVNRSEAKIFTMFTPYLKPDISDSESNRLQERLNNELVVLVKET